MLKVLVFDGGYGGEVVKDFLADELNVVEVSMEIDYSHGSYDSKPCQEIYDLAVKILSQHIGKFDLIVLGGYSVSLVLQQLQETFPDQNFVGVGINYYRILKANTYPEHITVMMNEQLLESDLATQLRRNLPYSTLTMPDCSEWEYLIRVDKLSSQIMRTDLEPYFMLAAETVTERKAKQLQIKTGSILESIMIEKHRQETQAQSNWNQPLIESDVVLLLNTGFWAVQEQIEKLFGYKVRVMSFRQKLLHDVCAALGLLGRDGQRSK